MAKTAVRPNWEQLVSQYATPDFIPADPISIPRRYLSSPDWRDAECAALIAALFSYGRRDKILETLETVLRPLGARPVERLLSASPAVIKRQTQGFYYRFNTQADLCFVLSRLGEVYRNQGSLKALWQDSTAESTELKEQIHRFRKAFLEDTSLVCPESYGMAFLFADPMRNSAAKRFNMFLRWMVREDVVDLGLWKDVLDPARLMIPLDTHVASMARQFHLTKRLSNDWKTAEEITAYFRTVCPADPVRYDFALFGLGVNRAASKKS